MKVGVWLGIELRSSEAIIGTPAGVVKTRTIRLLPEEQKWNADDILVI